MKNAKKWIKLSLAILLVLTFMISVTSCGVAGSSEAKDDNGKFDDIEWTYDADDKELVLSGSGEMKDFKSDEVPWRAAKGSIKTVKIGSGITSIGDHAFSFCPVLEKVTIPSTVTSIGDSAFEACVALEAVEIPAAVTSLGERVFAHCAALEEVIILGNVEKLESWAFKGCAKLDTLTVYNPDGHAPEVADDAFLECAIDGLDDDGVEIKTTNTTAVDITVKYVFENGDEAAEAVSIVKNKGESYDIASPEIEGYEADKTSVSGTVSSLLSINETVTYTALEAETEETTEVGGAEAPEAEEDNKKIGAGTIITIVVFVIVIAALVVFAVLMFRPDKSVTGKNNKNSKK